VNNKDEILPVGAVMIVAFDGWNDAGEAASAAISHLIDLWGGEEVVSISSDEYYDFQVNRPRITVTEEGAREIDWPATRFTASVTPSGDRQVVFVRGPEPNMRWRSFVDEIVGFAHDFDVSSVISLGSLLADAPHSRPVPITVIASDADMAQQLGLEPSRYEGPTGIVGVLAHAIASAGLTGVSIWAAIPHYVAHGPNPKGTLALLEKLEEILGEEISTGDYPEKAATWQHTVDEMASDDTDISEYVARLEEAVDTTSRPEATGDAIAKEFERYLQGNSGEPSV
jgi:predicted ATP-grasp superfamily ATP-dependent carboligase